MPRGIVFVLTSTLSEDGLPPEKLCDWVENTRIPEVLSLDGVTTAARYEKLEGVQNIGTDMRWLTVYDLADSAVADSDKFKELSGEKPAAPDLREAIFKHATFQTSVADLYGEDDVEPDPKAHYRFMAHGIGSPLEKGPDASAAFDDFIVAQRVPLVREIPGYRRSRMYHVTRRTKMECGSAAGPTEFPTHLTMQWFDSEKLPITRLLGVGGEEMQQMMNLQPHLLEIGFWRWKRGYTKADAAGG